MSAFVALVTVNNTGIDGGLAGRWLLAWRAALLVARWHGGRPDQP